MPDASTLIRRARLFEWYAKHLWSFHRHLAKGHLRRRCRNCSVSEAYAGLDAEGVCSECRAAPSGADTRVGEAHLPALAAAMDEVFRSGSGRGRRGYDAVVMLSGGKDSALLIHELRQRHPALRLVALTIDNSFMSPVALDNARLSIGKLDVPHVTVRAAPSLYRKSFRFACTRLAPGQGCFETVDRIDADLGFSVAKIWAATNEVPLLLSGLSWAQVDRIFGCASYEVPPAHALAKVTATLDTPLEELYAPAEMDYWWDPARFAVDRHPRFIHPFYVWRFPEQEIQARVTELGLIEPGNGSPLLTNNTIIPLMIVVDFLRLGYASFEPEFARLVREGRSDRIFWRNVFEMLEHSAKTGWMLERELDKIIAGLGLTRAEIGLVRGASRPANAASPGAVGNASGR